MEAHLESIRAHCESIMTCKLWCNLGYVLDQNSRRVMGPFGIVRRQIMEALVVLVGTHHSSGYSELRLLPCFARPQHDKSIPSSIQKVVEMLAEGSAQGFHVDYFFKGHGPTDFLRWAAAAAATEENKCEKGAQLDNSSTLPLAVLSYGSFCCRREANNVEIVEAAPSKNQKVKFLFYLCVTVGATPALTVSVRLQGYRAHH